MAEHNIDKLFKEKIDGLKEVPENADWDENSGWREYEKKYRFSAKKIGLYISAAAACVLLLVFLAVNISRRPGELIKVSNNQNTPKEVVLPDGNRIWLNKNSSASYFSKIEKNEIFKIKIEGEAFVEINELQTVQYKLLTENISLTVELPVSFNINAYPDYQTIDITVKKGALKIQETDNDEAFSLLISAGNYASVHKTHKVMVASSNTNQNYLAWKTGVFKFSETPMENVSEVLSKYYGKQVEFKHDSIPYKQLTGKFNAKNLVPVLRQIEKKLGISIETTKNKIIISENNS
jgi:transmembrane sensor